MTWFDLSHAFAAGMPVPDWPGEPNQEFTIRSFTVESTGGHQDFACLNLHSGTHVDAPGHYATGHASIDALPVERFVGTAYVADLTRGPLGTISAADLEPYTEQLDRHDMFFIRTGWEEQWGSPDYKSQYPFLLPDAGELLVASHASVLGLDTPGPDAPLRSGLRDGSPLHYSILGADMLIIENLTCLAEVVHRPLEVFAVPIKIEGAFGGPARVMAREL